MPNTYTWVVESLDCLSSLDGQTNVVITVHWRVNATDGLNTVTVFGTQPFTYSVENLFIPYADLTESTVINWVQTAIGAEAVAQLQEALDQQLEILANPPVVTPPLPWAE